MTNEALNRKIHEAMGLCPGKRLMHGWLHSWPHCCPDYTGDIKAAMTVVDWLRTLAYGLMIEWEANKKPAVTFRGILTMKSSNMFVSTANTLSDAICLAAERVIDASGETK